MSMLNRFALIEKRLDVIENQTNYPENINKVREKLADLEHEQWSHWTKYMLDNLTFENAVKWNKQINTPYSKLSEKEKDSDREWANKVIKIITENKK